MPPKPVIPRDVSFPIKVWRNFLLGREHKTALRHEFELAPRTTNAPQLPDGPCHELSKNYYYARDARREVKPPVDLALEQALLEAEASQGEPTDMASKPMTPGRVYHWDHHN